MSTDPHVVSISVHPTTVELLELLDRDTEGRQNDDIGNVDLLNRLSRITQEADAGVTQPTVNLRVVDDLTGQEDPTVGESSARLIGVVDGAVDAVAETELGSKTDHQTAFLPSELRALDLVDELAVIILGECARYLVLEIEAFSEDRCSHAALTRR